MLLWCENVKILGDFVYFIKLSAGDIFSLNISSLPRFAEGIGMYAYVLHSLWQQMYKYTENSNRLDAF